MVPVDPEGTQREAKMGATLGPLSSREPRSLDLILGKITERRLIRASQLQAAVKDSGVAKQLAKKLKLQGVVQMGDYLVAYIQVDRGVVKSVRKNEKVLDMIVEQIEPDRVTLSLDGVEVVLTH